MQNLMEKTLKSWTKPICLTIAIATISTSAFADYVITRAYRSATNAEYERLFINEVTRSGQTVNVGPSTMLNATLLDRQRIWAMLPIQAHSQLVYGAFDPNDGQILDELFVVDLRLPGRARQLNPSRTSPATQFLSSFAANGESSKVVYTLVDSATDIETLYLADTRNPGESTVVAVLEAGDRTGSQMQVSPDAAVIAYSVIPAAGAQELHLTFLNHQTNNVTVYSNDQLTNYNPIELAFSDDSTRLMWLDNGSQSEAGPLQSVTFDSLAGTIDNVVQVSAAELANERVSEFAIKPGTNNMVAYRSFAANSTAPSDTYLADASNPGTVTKLNNGPFRGAAFTTWEDVEWRGDSVLYNSTEEMLLRGDLFTVSESDPENTTILSRQVPFSPDRAGTKASGVSHFIQSPDNNKTAMVDGDPAVNLFVIDRFNIGTSFQPFDINSDRLLINSTDPGILPPQFNADSDMIAMVIEDSPLGGTATENLYVAAATSNGSEVPVLTTESPQVFDHLWFAADEITTSESTALAAAVLPASRSGQVGSALTAFVTLINGGSVAAEACSIDLLANIPASLSYQTTDPATNAPTGTADTPVDIPSGTAQSFIITINLNAQFAPIDAPIAYSCANADTVAPLRGLNTLLLSAAATPVPDVIALAATASGDGIVRLDSAGNGAFSVASINVGTGADITISATTSTGASVALCESDPATAACINPTSPTFGDVNVNIASNSTPTFSVFASSGDSIESNAAANRINVVFRGSDGNVRGQTSVAVQSDN